MKKNTFYLNKEEYNKLKAREGLSDTEVAEILDIPYGTFKEYARQRYRMAEDRIKKLGDLFNVPYKSMISSQPLKNNCQIKAEKEYVPEKEYVLIDHQKLIDAIERKGVSRKKMSRDLRISDAFVTEIKNGKKTGMNKALKMCDYLNVTIDYLTGGHEETGITKENSVVQTFEYKEFDSKNPMDNMNTINKNLITLGSAVNLLINKVCTNEESYNSLSNKFDLFANDTNNTFNLFKGVLKDIENNISKNNENNSISIKKKPFHKADSIAAIEYAKNHKHEDSVEEYKTKINTMITYISKKKDLIWGQVAHNLNKKFESTYGENITMLKKIYAKEHNLDSISDITVAEAIYNNYIYRDIYYNIVSDEVLSA